MIIAILITVGVIARPTSQKTNTNAVTVSKEKQQTADNKTNKSNIPTNKHNIKIVFPADRYPETAAHILAAIEAGHSVICTIDRSGAEENQATERS